MWLVYFWIKRIFLVSYCQQHINPFTATCWIYPAPADISLCHITEISGDLRIGCIVAWRLEHFVYSAYKYHS